MDIDSISIQTEALRRNFGDKVVLKDINLKIDAGDKIFLKGHNGSGKTTLLRILASLLEPTSGNVLFDGEGFLKNYKNFRKVIYCRFEK